MSIRAALGMCELHPQKLFSQQVTNVPSASVTSANRPVRTRMPGDVGRGREKLPLNRLANYLKLNDIMFFVDANSFTILSKQYVFLPAVFLLLTNSFILYILLSNCSSFKNDFICE
jgi:hypothetical protein